MNNSISILWGEGTSTPSGQQIEGILHLLLHRNFAILLTLIIGILEFILRGMRPSRQLGCLLLEGLDIFLEFFLHFLSPFSQSLGFVLNLNLKLELFRFIQLDIISVNTVFCLALNFDRTFSPKLKDFMVLMVKPHFLLLIFINFYAVD